MNSIDRETAGHLLRHLAIAVKKIQKKKTKKIKKIDYSPTEHEKKKIKALERKLTELNKVEKSFELLKQKLDEYTSIKEEEEIAIVKIKKAKAQKTIKKPVRKKYKKPTVKTDLKQFEDKLKALEGKYQQLEKKGYSQKDLKKVKKLIDRLKIKVKDIKK